MRFYRIVITDPDGNEVRPSSLGGLPLTSLSPDGSFNPGALNIEFDIPVTQFHTPKGAGFLKIWGLGLKDLGAAFNLNPSLDGKKYHQIAIYGGMSRGLPLANPSQARLLAQGEIIQSFGNWRGVEQTVDIKFTPTTVSLPRDVNFTLNWKANTLLSDALRQTLQNALPSQTLEINISPRLVQNHDEPGIYRNLEQLSTYLNSVSKTIITDDNYPGVGISSDGATIRVFDATTQTPPVAISFTDLVGQPTWIEQFKIQTQFVLRGDLDVGGYVIMPPTLATTTVASQAGLAGGPARQLTFSGKYQILGLHHYGNFRQSDAASWITVAEMLAPI
jgi:hypothetical protein